MRCIVKPYNCLQIWALGEINKINLHRMKNNRIVTAALLLVMISILITFLVVAKNILIPLAIGVFFAYLLYPMVWRIERKGVHRGISILLVIFAVFVLIASAAIPFSIKLSNVTIDLSDIKEQFDAKTDTFQIVLENKLGINTRTMDSYLEEISGSILSSWQSTIGSIFSATTTTIFQLAILPVFVFFFLFYRTKTAYFILRLVGKDNKPLALRILREVSNVTTRYLGGIFIVVAIVAVLNSTGLLIIGVNHAVVLGVLAAVLNLIPYIGTFLGGLIPFLFVYFNVPDPLEPMIKVVLLFVIVQFIENNLLTPNIVGSSIKINPLAIIVSLLFANMVWGVAGMLIVVPALAILKVIMRNIDSLKPYAFLISDKGTKSHDIKFKAIFKKIKEKFRNERKATK